MRSIVDGDVEQRPLEERSAQLSCLICSGEETRIERAVITVGRACEEGVGMIMLEAKAMGRLCMDVCMDVEGSVESRPIDSKPTAKHLGWRMKNPYAIQPHRHANVSTDARASQSAHPHVSPTAHHASTFSPSCLAGIANTHTCQQIAQNNICTCTSSNISPPNKAQRRRRRIEGE
jgi:hypothetical protein